ncbi:hypothetical protein SLNSH_02690 [Alsobacter soli]|uniref:General stress protein 17M-like domain-containing protein n=1 Tax=Alsobacter soli TaxID=2109933 RepID=A0A2T1HYQ0_9HYPH|nr:general stress protein [Alsobacter soli]PSC06720.1 hypothetical protein SLNSH_02690 [Alsobacter soli]
MTKTVSALYDSYTEASAAVSALEAAGFPHSDVSLVANNTEKWHRGGDASDAADDAGKGAGIGAALGGAGGLLAGLGMLAIPGLGPVVAAGWLASTAAGALAGAAVGGAAGGLVGALTDAGVPERDAHTYAEGVRRGGALVTARVEDARASEAQAILQRHRSVDVNARRAAYEQGGWRAFDPSAPAYTTDEIARERALYRSV